MNIDAPWLMRWARLALGRGTELTIVATLALSAIALWAQESGGGGGPGGGEEPPGSFSVNNITFKDTNALSRTDFCLDENIVMLVTHTCTEPIDGGSTSYVWSVGGTTHAPSNTVASSAFGAGVHTNVRVTVTITGNSVSESHISPAATITVIELDPVEFDAEDDALINGSLFQDKQGTLSVVVSPADRSIKWEVVKTNNFNKNVAVSVTLTDNQDKTATLKVDEASGSGEVTIRAADSVATNCYEDKVVPVGCPSTCSDGACAAGESDVNNGCVHALFYLGNAEQAQRAGTLQISATVPSLDLATPRSLSLFAYAASVKSIMESGTTNVLRQVKAPEVLADIVTVSPFKYEIRFYAAAGVGGQDTNGLYVLSGTPFIAYTVENPAANTNDIHALRITKTRGSDAVVYDYSYAETAGVGEWTLISGNGQKRETVSVATNALERVETRVLQDSAGVTASKTVTTFRRFDWGDSLIAQVADPDGAALTTTRTYYDNALHPGQYGKLRQVNNPNGSWMRYDYDPQGRTILEVSSWLDAASNAVPGAARAIYKSYVPVVPLDDGSVYPHQPRIVDEQIMGTTVSKMFYGYYVDTNNPGERVEIAEQAASPAAVYGAAGNLRTTRVYYPIASGEPDSGKLKSTLLPDERMDGFTYEKGEYAGGIFTPNPTGAYVRATVTHGTASSPAGIAHKTTRETTVSDQFGRTLLEEQYVYTGGGYERIAWSTYIRDEFGRELSRVQSNGERVDATWACCGKDYEKDAAGIEHTYSYDALKRLVFSTKEGVAAGAYPAQDAITTAYSYDAQGRQVMTVVSAESLSQVTSNAYDLAGRLVRSMNAAGLVTEYARSANGLIETATLPAGTTRITERYPDGKTKSVTGTANPAQYYEYGVNTDGSRWTKITTGTNGGPVWQKTTSDLLGRPVKTEKPGFSGTETTENFYNNKGQRIRNTVPGVADTLYEYDELGNQIRSGFDLNGNGALDLASMDRVNEGEASYQQIDGTWWQVAVQKTYAMDNDATPTTIGMSRQRLTGLGGSGSTPTVSESVSVDILGNQTIARTTIDRNAKMVTQTTDAPDSSVDAQTITINGLLVASRSKSGLTTTYTADTLGRSTGATDPRLGASVIHYDEHGRIDYEQDAAGHRTTYTYDQATGRKLSKTDALSNTTYWAYTAQGQEEKKWGSAVYPERYEYAQYNRKVKMATYRAGTNFDGATWPDSVGDGDVTTWTYHEASGLRTATIDAAGHSVADTYLPGGRPATRTLARTSGTNAIVITYSYDNAGNLTLADYSDSTPDVSTSYDRLGRPTTVTDGTGTRTFAYNASLQLISETLVSDTGTNVLARSYDSMGRSSGMALNGYYSTAYNFDPYGRFSSLNASVSVGASSVVNNVFSYSYLSGSDLLHQLTTDNGQLTTTRSYEDNRNLLTRIQNALGTNVVSQYDYAMDAGGRRVSAVWSGSAFEAGPASSNGLGAIEIGPTVMQYAYNSRSELIGAERFFGDSPATVSAPVAGQDWDYAFDAIGNRTRSTRDGETEIYTANNLNQYTQRTVPGAAQVAGTADEDATVTINRPSISGTTVEQVTRQGAYFHKKLALDNSTHADAEEIEVVGVKAGAGTNGADIVSAYTGFVWAVKTPEQFTYDADGNMLSDSLRKYEWDAENRLTAVTVTNVVDGTLTRVEMAYDYMNRRTKKSVFDWSAASNSWLLTSESFFVYDGWNVISELTTDNRQQSTNLYLWGLDLSGSLQGAGGVGGLLACYRSTTKFVTEDDTEDGHQHQHGQGHSEHGNGHGYGHDGDAGDDDDHDGHGGHGGDDDDHGDHDGDDGDDDDDEVTTTNRFDVFLYSYDGNGNVSELLNPQSEINNQQFCVAHYEYDAFGNLIAAVGLEAFNNAYRFSTKPYDDNTRLVNYGRRHYNPVTATFLSVDLIEPIHWSAYRFVDNNAINKHDVLGLVGYSDIDARLVYSIFCGWIDWEHATEGLAEPLWSQIVAEDGQRSLTKKGFRVMYQMFSRRRIGPFRISVPLGSGDYFVKYNLESKDKGVALGIFKEVADEFENVQSMVGTGSGNSEEDRPSDTIGFYMAVDGYSTSDIKQMCGARTKIESQCLYKKISSLGHSTSWSPTDYNAKLRTAICDNSIGALTWPSNLDTIKEEPKGDPLWRNWDSYYGIDEPRLAGDY